MQINVYLLQIIHTVDSQSKKNNSTTLFYKLNFIKQNYKL